MPTSDSTAIVRSDLGSIAWEYAMGADGRGFTGLRILPFFSKIKKAGEYPIIKIESLLKLQKTARAPRGAYNRSDYTFGKGNYSCSEHGWEELLDDSEREELGEIDFPAEEIAVMRAMDVVLRGLEQRIATKVQDTAALPDSAVSVPWSTAATATPRKDVLDVKETMRSTYGIRPNLMVISEQSKLDLLLTTEITDAFKYTNPIEIGGDEAQLRILAQYFGIEEVIVAGAQKDSAKKGQSKVLADIWDKTKAGLYKASSSRDLKDPALGRTFLWDKDSAQEIVVEQYRAETNRSDVFRARHSVGEEFIFTGAAHILTGVNV
jgi:hypothetical protein